MATENNTALWIAHWIAPVCKTKVPFHFAYFRKTFETGREMPEVRIHCATDSLYRLWVNGAYIGFGPARGSLKHPYYDTHAARLAKGQNTLALLVKACGEESRLLCQVEENDAVLAYSDPSWKASPATAYACLPGLLFPEAFDARLEPDGWQKRNFDDRFWLPARELEPPAVAGPEDLRPRPIPLIREKRMDPAQLLDTGTCCDKACKNIKKETDIATSLWRCDLAPLRSGVMRPRLKPQTKWRQKPVALSLGKGEAVYFILDFGREISACPEVAARGPAGVILDLGYSECLQDDRVPTRWQEHRQSERMILREGETRHRVHMARGFRYLMLRATNPTAKRRRVTLKEVCAHEALYPVKMQGKFRSSDPLLEKIYELSRRTVHLCMEDSFTDCPWRERSLWLGDLQPEALFGYYCFGEYNLARKCVLEFAGTNDHEGWVSSMFPTWHFNLPTWGMRFPVIAWEYYLYSGDRLSLPTLYESAKKQMAWLGRHESRDGLLKNMGLLPEAAAKAHGMDDMNFVDWTKLDVYGNDGVVQGWYLEALDCSARLAQAMGDRQGLAGFAGRASRLRKSLAKLYWSEKKKAFLKYRPNSPQRPRNAPADLIGQHENFLFALLGIGTPLQRQSALEKIAGLTGRYLPSLGDYQNYFLLGQHGNVSSEKLIRVGTPFWSFYALLALMEAGRDRDAIEYARFYWGLMLEYGATSCWEMWDRHTSLCHGWSAAPAMILPAYVLGIRPLEPGFAQFILQPHTGDLAWAEGRVPTPHGNICVAWNRDPDEKSFSCTVSVPHGTKAKVDLRQAISGRSPSIEIDGQRRLARKYITIESGRHIIQVG